jgi:regulator of nucleoside diphosphate kinase
MSNTIYPVVVIARHDHIRLKEVARAARKQGHPVADFLLAELRRARVMEERSSARTAGLDCHVTYRINFEPPKRRKLVLPENYRDSQGMLSVLSSAGAAILGLHERSRMAYRDLFGALHFVTVLQIESPSPRFNDFAPDLGPRAA